MPINKLDYGVAFGLTMGAAGGFLWSGLSMNIINIFIGAAIGAVAGIVLVQLTSSKKL
ncbi:MAG: hypothetical protein HY362_00615 [Candidatus Aenigmarchaeota archaeon]|nr:hypothetical protein [Candidatus Aenigmarchaeota archaeon]